MISSRSQQDRAGLERAIERLRAQAVQHPTLGHQSLLARLLVRAERLREAHEMYQAISLDVEAPESLVDEAAVCAERLGDLSSAEATLRTAITTREDDGVSLDLRVRLAEVVMARGGWAEAGLMAWQVTRVDTDHAGAWAVLAAVGWVTARSGIARAAVERLRSIDPQGGSNRVGACLARVVPSVITEHGADGEKSYPTMRVRRWRETEGPRLTCGASSAVDRLLVHSSRALLSEAAKRPTHADVWYHLAQTDLALGDKAGAVDALSKALVANPGYRAALSAMRGMNTTRQAA
ncbi:MAG: hypothetical protein RIG82_06015 [Phycisphaeraceae bacterium]